MKFLIALLAVAGLVISSSAYAEGDATPATKTDKAPAAKTDKAVEKAPVAKVAMEQITLSGKLAKVEKTFPGKDGKEMKKSVYTVTTADGAVAHLPPVKKAKEGEAAALDYDKFVDKDVKVAGEGLSREVNGKKTVMFKTVTSIDLAPAQ